MLKLDSNSIVMKFFMNLIYVFDRSVNWRICSDYFNPHSIAADEGKGQK